MPRCGVPKHLEVLWEEGILQVGGERQRLITRNRDEHAKGTSATLSLSLQ